VQCIAVQVIWQGAQETNARYSHLQQRREDLFVYSLPLTHARACSPDDAVHRAYHILSAFLLLALHCTAHRPLSRDLSATADLALPVSLALPRLPACLTCLLLAHRLQPSQPLEIGSRKYTSTRTPGLGRGLHRVGYMSTCGAVSFRLGRCSLWIFPGNVRLGRMGGRGSRSTS
jgi:hypothetical protein